MRFSRIWLLRLCLLLLPLVAVPAHAQQAQVPAPAAQSQQQAAGHIFGRVNCPQRVACPGSGASLTSSELMPLLTTCLKQKFGMDGTAFYDYSSSLNSQNCFTTSRSLNAAKGAIVPACCLVPVSESSEKCMFHCELTAN